MVTLVTPELRIDVVPGKGGDLISLVHRITGTELLLYSRWG